MERKCGLYARVSTEMQASIRDSSIDTQVGQLKSFIRYKSSGENPWSIVRVYKEKGKSGKNTERPELQSLFADIETGKINTVICTKIDRISRSLLDFYKMIELFEKQNVEFISLDENFDTSSPMGRAALKITLVFAELEREQTSKRTKDKMAWRAEQGLWNGGQVLGYDLVDKKLVPNKREAKIVKDMYEKYIELGSIQQVANWLNRQGYRSKEYVANRTGKKRGGNKFTDVYVSQKLRARVYIGEVTLKDKAFKGQQKAIIDKDLWYQVNNLLSIHAPSKKNPKRKTDHIFILQGLLRCGSCESFMTTKYATSGTGKRHFYYQCTQNAHNGKEGCPMKYVPAAKVEEFVLRKVHKISVDEDFIGQIILKANETVSDYLGELEGRKRDQENRLLAVKDNITNLIDAVAAKRLGKNESVAGRLDALEEQKAQIEQAIATLKLQIDDRKRKLFNADVMQKSLRSFAQTYRKGTPLEIKELLPCFIEHIIFTPQEIKIALYDREINKGLFVNQSGESSLDTTKWLPREDSNLGHSG